MAKPNPRPNNPSAWTRFVGVLKRIPGLGRAVGSVEDAWHASVEHEEGREAVLAHRRAEGYERKDVEAGTITWIGILLMLVVLVAGFLLWGLFNSFSASETASDAPQSPLAASQTPPEPRLQPNETAQWQEVHATAEATLNSYSWINRGSGSVRIPIERAIDLLAQRGLPSRDTDAPPSDDSISHDLDSSGGQGPDAPALTPTAGAQP